MSSGSAFKDNINEEEEYEYASDGTKNLIV